MLPRAGTPFCKAGGKGGEELLPSWPFSATSQEENISLIQIAPSTSTDRSQVLNPSITRCLLPPSDRHPDMQEKEQQLPKTKDGETGLRKPQVLDVNEKEN